MRWARLIWLVALVAVGAAGFFGGRTVGIQAGREQRTAAQGQFFGQRGGAPGLVAQGGAPGQGGQGAFRAGGALSGTVCCSCSTVRACDVRDNALILPWNRRITS